MTGDRLTAVDFEKEAESTATPLASVRWCSTTFYCWLAPHGTKNKIAPAVHHSPNKQQSGDYRSDSQSRENRPTTRHHTPDVDPTITERTETQTIDRRHYNGELNLLSQIRKSFISKQSCSPRPSLGRNINITDFQTLIATHAEENLNNVTTRRSPRPQGRARPTIPDQEATSQQRLNHSLLEREKKPTWEWMFFHNLLAYQPWNR
ncbi:hypothetical protein HID58_094901 [Brassica napus]|uniref:Uncharacterized protein n=1 Tax=Brassica napus TaxID=3708 RepID=A0ABQ7X823_BRANA|nr:hypothetical protein HID58_094901 [Brassica napus]